MDDRMIEIMSEVLIELKEMKDELKGINKRLDRVEHGVDKLEGQMAKNNLAIGELRLSVMRLAENNELVLHHETRIDALERKVFSN